MKLDNELFDKLLSEAAKSERLRYAFDLRTSPADTSQRMLNALLPGTVVPIHRHTDTAETAILLSGRLTERIYDDHGNVLQEYELNPTLSRFGFQIPAGAWHTIEVHEPSVLFEAKDGAFVPNRETLVKPVG